MIASPAIITAAAQPQLQRRLTPYRMKTVGLQLRGQTCRPDKLIVLGLNWALAI